MEQPDTDINPAISDTKKVSKKSLTITAVIATLGVVLIAIFVYSYLTNNGDDIAAVESVLTRISAEMNSTMPIMVDKDTRLDETTGGPGRSFIYAYSLINNSKENLNLASLEQSMRPRILENYKINEQMKYFRDAEVKLHYRYEDKNGIFLFEIVVSPQDF